MTVHARQIWDAAVAAAEPRTLVREELTGPLAERLQSAQRVLVVGGGKAGAAMAQGLEDALADRLDGVEGIVNVPAGAERPLRRIVAHPARPAGSNFPTAEGVVGAERMLRLMAESGPDDVAICLLSGGGSALLPAPVASISLEDKLETTRLLYTCGATINEMNAVRKHLSRLKGGWLAQAFRGRQLFSLIISDVVGDPLDVIASGPTAPDPTTFADVVKILRDHEVLDRVPATVRQYLERGASGNEPETLKQPLDHVEHRIIGNNLRSLKAAHATAEALGYRVLNLGSFIEGETRVAAEMMAGIVRSILADSVPLAPPCCLLSGGETTVTLGSGSGKGGRNQEFVLAMRHQLGTNDRVVILSGGTDGEDGPTDAAGAIGTAETLANAARLSLDPADFLARHDAYPFFDRTGGLLRTGLTGTNVMDVRVILVR